MYFYDMIHPAERNCEKSERSLPMAKKNCFFCKGSGKVDCSSCGGYGEDDDGDPCNSCKGAGVEDCSSCDGTGQVDDDDDE